MEPELYLVRAVLEPQLCRGVRAAMDRGVRESAEVLVDGISEPHDVRRADSIEIDPRTLASVEARLDEQQAALEAFFGISLQGREGAGFLRYADGGVYRPHVDRADDAAWPGAARRRLTVVVFLNDQGFTGGVLRIGGVNVTPTEGLLVAFRSEIVHEVTPVAGGTRDTIVDWFLGE